jgi:hypothetical protein
MAAYVELSKTKHEDIQPYCKLSSLFYILFDLTNWDFSKYIVYKEKYVEVCLFHIEIAKKALQEAAQKIEEVGQQKK